MTEKGKSQEMYSMIEVLYKNTQNKQNKAI